MIARHVKLAIVCLLSTTGCSNPTVLKPLSALSSRNSAANAPILARFVEQQCFDRSENTDEFASGLRATGWGFERIQSGDPNNPLSLALWNAPNVEVVRGQPVAGAVYVCTVMVRRAVAPPASAIKAALSDEAGTQPAADGNWWWWKRLHTRKLHMEINEVNDHNSIGITVETYRLPWWQSILA